MEVGMRVKSKIAIWLRYKEDGEIVTTSCGMYFRSWGEAQKCADYLTSKIENIYSDYEKLEYFCREELCKEYTSFEDFIETTAQEELSK